jgi:hypothetical protein
MLRNASRTACRLNVMGVVLGVIASVIWLGGLSGAGDTSAPGLKQRRALSPEFQIGTCLKHESLEVSFASTKHNGVPPLNTKCGVKADYRAMEYLKAPKIRCASCDPNNFYALEVIGPRNPTPTTGDETVIAQAYQEGTSSLFYLTSNIGGAELTEGVDLSQGGVDGSQVIAHWQAPSAMAGAIDTYTFLLYDIGPAPRHVSPPGTFEEKFIQMFLRYSAWNWRDYQREQSLTLVASNYVQVAGCMWLYFFQESASHGVDPDCPEVQEAFLNAD